MARSITEIKATMIASIQADATLSGLLTSTSAVALFNLFCYIIAVCAFSLENLFDLFKKDVDEVIDNKDPHTALWYVNMAKKFQYGYNLVPEKDYYDNTGIADDVVAASKIVAYAAVTESPRIRMKVAKLSGSALTKLTAPELASFVAYIKRIKDAGVKLKETNITSTDADKLRLVLRVKYNPLVMDGNGARRDGTSPTPVKDAVRNYLANLDFNGLFSVQKLVDYIQAVDGVDDLKIDGIQTQYGLLPFTAVDISFVPDSGYLIIDDVDFIPTYIAA